MSTVFWLAFGLIVLVLAGVVVLLVSKVVGASDWEEVEAVVLESGITPVVGPGRGTQRDPEIGSGYRLDVLYEYTYRGVEHQSTKVIRGLPAAIFPTEPRAERALADYPAGAVVTAYVNPADPSAAVLMTTRRVAPAAWVALYCFLVVLLTAFGLLALTQIGIIDMRSIIDGLKGDSDVTHVTRE